MSEPGIQIVLSSGDVVLRRELFGFVDDAVLLAEVVDGHGLAVAAEADRIDQRRLALAAPARTPARTRRTAAADRAATGSR